MTRIPITTGDALHLYGGLGLNIDYNVRICLQMDGAIDETMLTAAVEKTQKRYPYLSLRLRRDEHEYYYEENPAPVTVHHTDGRISLNSEETNRHIWAVCWNEDRLYLDISHGALDGTGMYMVLSTLLYYYCHDRYGVTDHTGIRTLEDPIRAEETLDPMDRMPSVDPSLLKAPGFPQAFSLVNDAGLTVSEQNIWDIEIPEAAFVRFSSANDASPGTMVSILMSRTIDELFPERTAPLMNSYVVNARPMVNAPLTHHNCTRTVFFNYSDRVKAMPFDRQCTVHRGTTFIQSDPENVMKQTIGSANRYRMILAGMPTVEAKEQTFAKMLEAGKILFTYMVSYVGKWKWPALAPYIKAFWTHVPNANNLLTEIAAINGKIFLSVHQSFSEDVIVKAFLNQLEKNGVPYEVKQHVLNDVARTFSAEPVSEKGQRPE